jgi:hypothetical protein
MIGSGEILSKVIQAIELPGNNLIQWEGRNGPASRAHLRIIEAKEDAQARRELESPFFDLYHRGKADKNTFEAIVALCGKRYELLGYLFFIAAPERFLPLRTRSFDKAFAELGVNLHTEGNCGWENYLSFLAAISMPKAWQTPACSMPTRSAGFLPAMKRRRKPHRRNYCLSRRFTAR